MVLEALAVGRLEVDGIAVLRLLGDDFVAACTGDGTAGIAFDCGGGSFHWLLSQKCLPVTSLELVCPGQDTTSQDL